mgnify:CR=1 FL=1
MFEKIADTLDFYSTAIFQYLSKKEENMTKKKSIWAFVLAFMLFVPAMFLFSACGKHKHSYSSEWTKTESQHWHACTDKNCEEKSDLADHDFVWVEKTPAGVHTDKVETGTCSTCQYQKDRTIEGSGDSIHSWERKSDATKHWEETTCTQHDPIKRNEEAHTWQWKANEHKHWQQTTCEQGTPLKQNEQNHTWVYTSEDEFTHRRQTNCGEEKHATRIEPKIAHTYTDENDVDCNDCGYIRSLVGKGSFGTLSAKTYNAGAQGVASSDYTVDEKIKDLCEIQYKVKDANDSTYTTTAPTNAGTYEVRIYCRGNATYLKGEVAKAELVINKYKVEIAKNLSFKVAYNETAMDDDNVQYIHLGTVRVSEGLVEPVDVPIKAPKIKLSKNPGRKQVYVEDLLTEDDNFAIKELPSSDALRRVTLVHYDDSVVATLTSAAEESKIKWDTTTEQVGITVTRVNNGTIRVGDYMICEGYSRPLEVVALKLEYNVPTDMLVNGDSNCEIYFDYSSFADLATAKPILANKTFTEVETLNFVEGKNYTNTVSRQLNKGESFYLVFTTEASANVKTYKVNFETNGTGYETSGSVLFLREDGTTAVVGNELNVKSEGIYFVKVTKTADSDAGKESVDFNITKR